LAALGLVDPRPVKFFGAQATGCSPISDAIKNAKERFDPQKPATIARSLAIGNPADGHEALKVICASGGWAEDAPDPEIVAGMRVLAETEGIFTETAGGVTAAVAQKLVAQGRIDPEETTVLCVTGNGLKTTDALAGEFSAGEAIEPRLACFETYLDSVAGSKVTAASGGAN
jgi:threonine synthase